MNFNVVSREDNNVVFPSYYEYFARIYGETFFSNVCRVAISNGRYESRSLSFLDDAYSHTKDTVNSSLGNNDEPKIIAVKGPSGEDKGFFRIRFIQSDDLNLACVAELVLPYEGQELDRVQSLKELITAIEMEVVGTCTDVDCLDFEAGTWDAEMQEALLDMEFSPIDVDKARCPITCIFEKKIRKQKATRD